MKGTYDNDVNFSIAFADKDTYVLYLGDYDNYDGSIVTEIIHSFSDERIEACTLLGVQTIDKTKSMDDLNTIILDTTNIIARIDKPFYENTTFEYLIAQEIGKTYQDMNITSKKYSLAFLERYVLPFEEVRKFQQTGVLDLSNVDKTFGYTNNDEKPKTMQLG